MKLIDLVKWGVIIAFLMIIITSLSIYGYAKYKHYTTKKKTYEYLIEYGYQEEDILNIESRFQKLTMYTAKVIFTDEKNVIYDYTVRNKKVEQIDAILNDPTIDEKDYTFKHLENNSP